MGKTKNTSKNRSDQKNNHITIHKNNYLNIFKKIAKCALATTTISEILKLVKSANASPITLRQCYYKADDEWTYRIVLGNGVTLDKLSFFCRIFKKFCDANNPNLNPMEKKAIEIYNSDGKKGDYMPLIYRYFKYFFHELFCNTRDSFHESSFTLRDIPICPQALRNNKPSWVEKCNSQAIQSSIVLKGCFGIKNPQEQANCINGLLARIG